MTPTVSELMHDEGTDEATAVETRVPADVAALPGDGRELVMRARGLMRRYRMGHEVVEVLRGVDFDLRRGESVAIMGRSGAGKSTLLHLLGLLDTVDSGSLEVEGVDTTRLSTGARSRLRNDAVGFVFQFYHLIPELTALENAMLPLRIASSLGSWMANRKRHREEVRALLVELGLSSRLFHRPNQLSGGERQRVALARALVNRPRVLLCDEPTGNLDERTAEGIADQLFDLAQEHGQTIVLVTHDGELAQRADRTLVMTEGRLGLQDEG